VQIRWLRTALKNLNEEAEYIALDSPNAAANVIIAITQAVDSLAKYPALGRPGRVAGTRELVVSGTPYVVPYRVRAGSVEILRIFHGARKWPESF
jgi:addiction module RelE/StbE family toxin